MSRFETGYTRRGISFVRNGCHPSIVVLNGGQGFVRVASTDRLARDARRAERLLPDGAEFVLIGYDPKPPPDLSIHHVVESVCGAIDELAGDETVDLVGISYGGMVACRVAATRPRLVRHLVLTASGHRFSTRGAAHVRRQVDLLEKGDLTEFAQAFTALFRRPWYNWLIAAAIRMTFRRIAGGMAPAGMITRYLRAMLAAETLDLTRVEVPTQIIGGSADQFFGEGVMEEAAVALPQSELIILPKETHMAPVETAKAFKVALTKRLTR